MNSEGEEQGEYVWFFPLQEWCVFEKNVLRLS
jgi:hypothetical protein